MKRIIYAIFCIILLISAAPAYWPTTVEQQLILREDPVLWSDIRERSIPMTGGRTMFIWNDDQPPNPGWIMYQIVDGYGEFQYAEHQILYNLPMCASQEAISDGAGGCVVLISKSPLIFFNKNFINFQDNS